PRGLRLPQPRRGRAGNSHSGRRREVLAERAEDRGRGVAGEDSGLARHGTRHQPRRALLVRLAESPRGSARRGQAARAREGPGNDSVAYLAAPAEVAEEGETARAADGEEERAHHGRLRERRESAGPQRRDPARHDLDLRADGRGARLAFRLHEEVREALEGEVARALRYAA